MFQSRNQRVGVTSRLRLRGHDYSHPGYYFLTVCVQDRSHRFGTITNDCFLPNPAGTMVAETWLEAPGRFSGVSLDAFCVMPNHVHAILGIGIDEPEQSSASVPEVMNWFKSVTTVAYIRGVKEHDWPSFDRRLWQEKYHDYIVRNDRDLSIIRAYVEANPAKWSEDTYWT